MAYDRNTDYQALIDAAAAKGDYASAARYEQQRNEKIAATGDAAHAQTNLYSAFLDGAAQNSTAAAQGTAGGGGGRTSAAPAQTSADTDYQALINAAAARGDLVSAARYEQQRNEKIAATGDTAHTQTNLYSAFLGDSGAAPGMDLSLDYQALINAAAAQGNYTAAAQYELLRNRKLSVLGQTQNATHLYESYLTGKTEIQPTDIRAPELRPLLDAWRAAAEEQVRNSTDYAVQTGTEALRRTEEDAQQQFRIQRDQIAADEARALDNQALYAERRGDRGGIGAAQYGAIRNDAARNRLAVSQAQTRLSTDTARQIADLRAQGEFARADRVLETAQSYLSQLLKMEQWSAQFELGAEEFDRELEKWNFSFESEIAGLTGYYRNLPTSAARQLALQTGSLTGVYDGEPTLAAQKNLAEAGLELAKAGIRPSQSQMEALEKLYGYTPELTNSLVEAAKAAAAGGYGTGKKKSAKKSADESTAAAADASTSAASAKAGGGGAWTQQTR